MPTYYGASRAPTTIVVYNQDTWSLQIKVSRGAKSAALPAGVTLSYQGIVDGRPKYKATTTAGPGTKTLDTLWSQAVDVPSNAIIENEGYWSVDITIDDQPNDCLFVWHIVGDQPPDNITVTRKSPANVATQCV